MSTWSLQQIRNIELLHVAAMVDLTQPNQDALRAGVVRSAKQAFIEMAHTFAADVDERDLVDTWIEPSSEPGDFRAKCRVTWRPAVREVELRGGYEDGQRAEFRHAPSDLWVTEPRSQERRLCEPDNVLTPTKVLYRMVGWLEADRVWLYAPERAE